MASSNTASSSSDRRTIARSNSDSARWIGGLVLLFIGLFVAASVFFSYFSWAADQSGLQLSAEQRATLRVEPDNACGWLGARLGQLLVDNSFGVMGMLLPVMLILTGIRIIRRRALLFNHSILSLLLITILGSLTLGFAFGDRWSLCCSTGWGGAFGIGTSELLGIHIGGVGTTILLLGGWILTGVFINRNFINTVNDAGNVMVDRGGKIVDIVRHKVAAGVHSAADAAHFRPDREAEDPTARPAPAAESAPHADAAPESRDGGTEPVRPRPLRAADSDGFEGFDGSDLPAAGEPLAPEEASAAPHAAPHAAMQPACDEEAFVEVDLSSPGARVVMGPGGLVELRRTEEAGPDVTLSEAPAAASDAPEQEPAAAGDDMMFDPDDPFVEITVGRAAPEGGDAVQPVPSPAPERRPAVGALPQEEGIVELSLVPAPHGESGAEQALPEAGSQEPAADGTPGVVVTVEARSERLADERRISTESYDPLKDLVNYRRPPVTLLEDYVSDSEVSDEEIFDNKTRIEETLRNFGIPIQRIKATVGPTVTLYEIVQAQGVKISKIQGLQNDIAQSLKAESGIRIIAPIPGRGTIGIEVPNRNKQVVSMYSAIRSLRFQESKAELPVVIGRTIQNENFVFDLAKLPHLLVAGATGQGKSVGLNAIITSLLYRKHPAQLKFVMIDPKMVEFSLYARMERHFLAKMESEEEAIITDPKKAVYTLNALCTEMDNRLELCKEAGARNITEYNGKFTARRLNPQKGHRYLPYIVVIIDEFADLIMMAKEVEMPVIRLAQKARAVGIHLIIATQRPSVDVITGKIKANFPSRIAFRVVQRIDSQTIIDQPGANQLIGRGDMLISKEGQLTRVQCALVETAEVERIVDHIAGQQGYAAPYALPDYTPEGGDAGGMGSEEAAAPVKYDSLFAEIAREAVASGQISTSMIQRNYEVGFNRAGRIMMQLERAGIVGRQQGAKPRDILFHDSPSLEAKLQDLGLF